MLGRLINLVGPREIAVPKENNPICKRNYPNDDRQQCPVRNGKIGERKGDKSPNIVTLLAGDHLPTGRGVDPLHRTDVADRTQLGKFLQHRPR